MCKVVLYSPIGRLLNLFNKLHFKVAVREDMAADEMYDWFREVSQMDHSQFDCFACCIMSHGELGAVRGSDGENLEIQDILEQFKPIACKSLIDKPKLFFIQVCGFMCYFMTFASFALRLAKTPKGHTVFLYFLLYFLLSVGIHFQTGDLNKRNDRVKVHRWKVCTKPMGAVAKMLVCKQKRDSRRSPIAAQPFHCQTALFQKFLNFYIRSFLGKLGAIFSIPKFHGISMYGFEYNILYRPLFNISALFMAKQLISVLAFLKMSFFQLGCFAMEGPSLEIKSVIVVRSSCGDGTHILDPNMSQSQLPS